MAIEPPMGAPMRLQTVNYLNANQGNHVAILFLPYFVHNQRFCFAWSDVVTVISA